MPPSSVRKTSGTSLPAGYQEDPAKPPMFRFEASLPKLPVPTLEETAARYLKSVHPLLSRSELASTTQAVQDFIRPGGGGHKLQERLIARQKATTNWVYQWWNNAAYLAVRDPVHYSSYFYSYLGMRGSPSKRAAAISTAALEVKKLVDHGLLEPDYMRKMPSAMETFQWMFNACRVPARPADHVAKYPFAENKHITVITQGPVLQSDARSRWEAVEHCRT